MKRFFAGLFAIALVTGCSSLNTYNSNSTLSVTQAPATVTATSAAIPHTQTPSATQTASTSVSTQAEIRSDLILGENYNLKSLGIVFQNLYRSKDKAGRDGLLVEYTTKWQSNLPGEELPQLELEVLQAGKRIRAGGDPPGHEMVNYSTLDLLPGGTLQHLVFFESVPDQDIEISLQTVLKDTAGYRLNAKYPADLVDLGKLGDKLKKDRLDLNKIYLSEVPDEEDLSLTGQTLEFSMAEFIIREIKTVPNDIIGGRDLIVTYSYRLKPSQEKDPGKEDHLDVQIQAFQYGIEIERRFIDQDSRGTDTEYRDGDFIVNYRDVGALVIRVLDPKLRKQLVFVPGTSDAP